MAENNKGGILNKAEKILRRRKTKVLQSLGKQEKTKDDILAEDCQRLDRQQEVANKFQKDLRHYIHSARALSQASKTFYTTVAETYEPEWENHAQITEILNNMDMLWQDYLQKLTDQVQEPLAKYIANIPQIKARVAKRGRKLIDFDNAKHSLEVHQQAKKKDEAKIAKAKEDLEHVQKIYDDLNNELHHELPEFYHSRVSFYGNLFHDLFSAESVFQTEAGKVWESAPDCSMLMGSDVISSSSEKLAQDHKHQTYTPRKNLRNTVVVGSNENLTNGHSDNGAESPRPDTPGSKPSTSTPTTPNSPWTAEPVTNGNTDADTSKDSIEGSSNIVFTNPTHPTPDEPSSKGAAGPLTNSCEDDLEDSDENVSEPVKPKEVAEVKVSKGEDSRATDKETKIKAEVSSKVNAVAKETVTVEAQKPHHEDEKVIQSTLSKRKVHSAVSITLKHDITNQNIETSDSDFKYTNQEKEALTNDEGEYINIHLNGQKSTNQKVGYKEYVDNKESIDKQETVQNEAEKGTSDKKAPFRRQNTHEEVLIDFHPITGHNRLSIKDHNNEFTFVGNILYDTVQAKVSDEGKLPDPDKQVARKDHEEAKVNGDLDTSTEAEIPDDAPPPVPASPPPEEAAREGKGNKADDDSDHDHHEDDDDEEEEGQDDGLYQVPPPAKPVDDDLPAKYLYTVIATHAYKGEDDDELSFDSQEIIYVIDYDDPEEQDPGWLMGVRKINRETGVFPENFTKRV